MNTKPLIYSAAVVLAIAGIIFFGLGRQPGAPAPANNVSGNNQVNSGQTNSSLTLFNNTQYAPYSYLISSNTISQQAQMALAGFNLTVSYPKNGSKLITLSLIGTRSNRTFVLSSGYKLYIIETAFGDDNFHYDSSLGDDGFVVVTPKGYMA